MKNGFRFAAVMCIIAFSVVSCEDKDEQGPSYKVGDLYHVGSVKGIVYKVTTSGRHGLLVSLDENASLQWATEAAAWERTGAIEVDDGEDNTEEVMSVIDWQSKFPAFAWCASQNAGGRKEWFIPAYYQLAALYEAYTADKEVFNGWLTDNGGMPMASSGNTAYWSSSENPIAGKVNEAVFLDIETGDTGYKIKSEDARVRIVHEF